MTMANRIGMLIEWALTVAVCIGVLVTMTTFGLFEILACVVLLLNAFRLIALVCMPVKTDANGEKK